MNLNFCSLSSGSSGNCYYLGNEFHGILIDAGLSATNIRKFLQRSGISIQTIMGIIVTHNHWDHIKGLEVLTRRYHIPAFTTYNVWNSILSPRKNIPADCIRKIHLQIPVHLAGFDIEVFPVHHDAPETIGVHIRAGSRKITIATDLGHICDTAAAYIRTANLLVIESNYDQQMLTEGSYPYYLKTRILSGNGHLGNHQTSAFLAGMLNDGLSHICLAHLSENNNTPEKALLTLKETLSERGIILNGHPLITVLKRNVPSEMIQFTD